MDKKCLDCKIFDMDKMDCNYDMILSQSGNHCTFETFYHRHSCGKFKVDKIFCNANGWIWNNDNILEPTPIEDSIRSEIDFWVLSPELMTYEECCEYIEGGEQ